MSARTCAHFSKPRPHTNQYFRSPASWNPASSQVPPQGPRPHPTRLVIPFSSLRSRYQRRAATGRDRGTRQLSSTSPPSTACSRTSTTGFSGATGAGRRGKGGGQGRHRGGLKVTRLQNPRDQREQGSPVARIKHRGQRSDSICWG